MEIDIMDYYEVNFRVILSRCDETVFDGFYYDEVTCDVSNNDML